jgi:hypothetical protein
MQEEFANLLPTAPSKPNFPLGIDERSMPARQGAAHEMF